MTITPIETLYKGYRFRSRLEARWAVFFDALGLQWEYEPEGFITSAGWYLPDFAIRREGMPDVLVEVRPTDAFEPKVKALNELLKAEGGGRHCQFVFGDPRSWFERRLRSLRSIDEMYGDKTCPQKFDFLVNSLERSMLPETTFTLSYVEMMLDDDQQCRLFVAANSARAARFEHGEVPGA